MFGPSSHFLSRQNLHLSPIFSPKISVGEVCPNSGRSKVALAVIKNSLVCTFVQTTLMVSSSASSAIADLMTTFSNNKWMPRDDDGGGGGNYLHYASKQPSTELRTYKHVILKCE